MDKSIFDEFEKEIEAQNKVIGQLQKEIEYQEKVISDISEFCAGFRLGKIVWTSGVYEKLREDSDFSHFVTKSMQRYMRGDWGEMDPEDKELNDSSLSGGGRIFAAYENAAYRIWIITEWDRSVTTILFPEEY